MPSIHIEKEMQELFEALHASQIFPDGKTIADANMELSPEQMLSEYAFLKKEEEFDLKAFFEAYTEPNAAQPDYKSDPKKSTEEHINTLWSHLTRKPKKTAFYSTLIPLPKKYIVPGGRFNEIYYWDSYFTMLGLQVCGQTDLIENMVQNFSWLIDQYGHIPNGNRTYFISRSQPPFFAHMIELLAEINGEKIYNSYLPQLQKEYTFWMNNTSDTGRAVQVGAHLVNRYGDQATTPRIEMYSDDLHLIQNCDRDAGDLMVNIRAACESGWDFSSRWFGTAGDLSSIRTRSIIPVDLNCLLYNLERTIAKAALLSGDTALHDQFDALAQKRKEAILSLHWNDATGYFHDYDLETHQCTPSMTLAGMFPLFEKIATKEQAQSCSKNIEKHFLKAGGLITTTIESGQQWDAPNGWAPLQWISIQGLHNYSEDTLANDITARWTALNQKVYRDTGKLMEKYNVVDINLPSGGGEYPVQDGFGWTNGVLLRLLDSKSV